MARLTFNNTGHHFYPAVKSAVGAYLKAYGLQETGNVKLYLKAVFSLLLLLDTYNTSTGSALTIALAIKLRLQ